jgi:hypothetical protein
MNIDTEAVAQAVGPPSSFSWLLCENGLVIRDRIRTELREPLVDPPPPT